MKILVSFMCIFVFLKPKIKKESYIIAYYFFNKKLSLLAKFTELFLNKS